MELGLQFTDLTCWEKTGHAAVSHEETMETAIAEYCPDMTRIVTACGQLYIREKTASEERVTVSGTVRVTVLYTSEESTGLRSLTVSVPFSCAAEDQELASAQLIWATGRLLLVEAQAVTARKLYFAGGDHDRLYPHRSPHLQRDGGERRPARPMPGPCVQPAGRSCGAGYHRDPGGAGVACAGGAAVVPAVSPAHQLPHGGK